MPAPLLDFCSLQHIRVRKSTDRGVSRPRFVPPSGFGYPLDGLLLPSPRRPCFVPAALLGFRPSESSPLERYPPRFRAGCTHMPFTRPVPPTPKRWPVPTDRSSWALTLPRVPCVRHVFSMPKRRILPWASSLPGSTRDGLVEIPLDLLSRASSTPSRRTRSAGAPEYQSALAWPRPPSSASRRAWTRQPS
jgi:hypothetical protein